MSMADQLTDFNARVTRINDPKNTSYRDPETGMLIPKRVSKKEIIRKKFGETDSFPSLIFALLVGALCLMMARFIRWYAFEMPEVGGVVDANLLADISLAGFVTLAIGGVLGLRTARKMVAQFAGIAVMIVAMHNLVWMYPAEFAQIYSQTWVDQVQQTTAPNSLSLRGTIYTL